MFPFSLGEDDKKGRKGREDEKEEEGRSLQSFPFTWAYRQASSPIDNNNSIRRAFSQSHKKPVGLDKEGPSISQWAWLGSSQTAGNTALVAVVT